MKRLVLFCRFVLRATLGKVAFDLAEPPIRTIGEQVQRQDAERTAKPLETASGEA